MQLNERFDLGIYATFIPNKRIPIYNWFYFKEGFSKQLVEFFIKKFSITNEHTVLDPFLGSGTTCLCCKQNSINSIGIDVSELALLVSRVKTSDYNLTALRKEIDSLLNAKFRKIDFNIDYPLVKKAFPKNVLEEIYFLKNEIHNIENMAIKDFLLLALITSVEKSSFALKSGSIIKIFKKKHLIPLKKALKTKLFRMYFDLNNVSLPRDLVRIEKGDARKLLIKKNSVNYCITSPPYLNKIEYARVYSIENYLFFPGEIQKPIRSFFGLNAKESFFLPEIEMPLIARAYFRDLDLFLKELYKVLVFNGKAAIVLSNACFPSGVIECDKILATLAEENNFIVEEIIVLNKRICTKERTIKIGVVRESIVILKKQ